MAGKQQTAGDVVPLTGTTVVCRSITVLSTGKRPLGEVSGRRLSGDRVRSAWRRSPDSSVTFARGCRDSCSGTVAERKPRQRMAAAPPAAPRSPDGNCRASPESAAGRRAGIAGCRAGIAGHRRGRCLVTGTEWKARQADSCCAALLCGGRRAAIAGSHQEVPPVAGRESPGAAGESGPSLGCDRAEPPGGAAGRRTATTDAIGEDRRWPGDDRRRAVGERHRSRGGTHRGPSSRRVTAARCRVALIGSRRTAGDSRPLPGRDHRKPPSHRKQPPIAGAALTEPQSATPVR